MRNAIGSLRGDKNGDLILQRTFTSAGMAVNELVGVDVEDREPC